jgi:hypothetical protein
MSEAFKAVMELERICEEGGAACVEALVELSREANTERRIAHIGLDLLDGIASRDYKLLRERAVELRLDNLSRAVQMHEHSG